MEGILNTTISDEPAGQRGEALQKLPAAVLWDMDGTLVDTEPYWFEAEHELALEAGATWTEADQKSLVGSSLSNSAQIIATRMGLALSTDEIIARLLDGVIARVGSHVPWRPGALALLGSQAELGVPAALVTMSYRRLVDLILSSLPEATFAEVVTGDTVAHGKPHPEPYLTAAARLGVAPADCLAIEDSVPGAASAEAAGCRVVVIPAHVKVPASPRRIERPTLEGVDLVELFSAAGQVRGFGA
ncbi:MAG: HAD family hydrolase [Nocardioides sp.]